MNKKKWLLIGILLVAAAVRFYNPTFRSLWGDEIHSVYNAINFNYSNLLTNSHLPVYFILLSFWIKLFGIGEYSLRLLSILIGITAVAAFYLFSKRMFDEKTASAGTLLLAISPLAIMHSQEIRMYGLLLLLSILSSWCLWESLENTINGRKLFGYLITTILLALTHIFGILLVAAQLLYLLYYGLNGGDKKIFWPLLVVQLLAVALVCLPYFQIALINAAALISGTSDMAFSVFPAYLKFFLVFFVLSLGETVAPWNLIIVLPAGLALGYLYIRSFGWFQEKKMIYLQVLCLFPIIISVLLLKPTMPKYLIIALPFYLLLIGRSLVGIRSKILGAVIMGVLLFTSFCSIYNYFSLREYHNSNLIEPWREAAAVIKDGFSEQDAVITSNHFIVYRLMQYYLNQLSGSDLPVYSLQEDIYTTARAENGQHPIYSSHGKNYLENLQAKRIWLVTHIADDRAFPSGYLEGVKEYLTRKYTRTNESKYIPYEQTLASKLPIGRHRVGANRITVSLYLIKGRR